MLLDDELFSDGKLIPALRSEISSTDLYLFSPKAPRFSSCWKDLLGLKKLYHNSNPKLDPDRWGGSLVWWLISGKGDKRANCINQQEPKIADFLGGEGVVTNVERRLHQLMLSVRDFEGPPSRTVSLPTTPSIRKVMRRPGWRQLWRLRVVTKRVNPLWT